MRLDQLVGRVEFSQALLQFHLDLFERLEDRFARRHVMGLGIDSDALDALLDLTGQRIEDAQLLDLVIEQLDTHRLTLGVGRMDIDDIAAHPVGTALEFDVVARVLQLGEPAQHAALVDQITLHDMQQHLQVGLRVTETVDRRHRGHDDRIVALEQ